MNVIWEHSLAVADGEQAALLPAEAIVVHVGMQHSAPTIWFQCDPEADRVLRRFHLVGTGHPFPDDLHHVGTCFDGPWVWHVLENRS